MTAWYLSPAFLIICQRRVGGLRCKVVSRHGAQQRSRAACRYLHQLLVARKVVLLRRSLTQPPPHVAHDTINTNALELLEVSSQLRWVVHRVLMRNRGQRQLGRSKNVAKSKSTVSTKVAQPTSLQQLSLP